MIEGLTDIDSGQALVDGLDVATQPYQVKKIIGVQLRRMNISIIFPCANYWHYSAICMDEMMTRKNSWARSI